jgi:hypothetical protein
VPHQQESLLLLVQVLRHLKVMLQMRQRLAGPVLQLRIIAAFGVTLEQDTASLCALTCMEA